MTDTTTPQSNTLQSNTPQANTPQSNAITVPSRRQFLGGAIAASAAVATSGAHGITVAANVFLHGVASGDPLATAVVLWTRVSGQSRPTLVTWKVAVDEAMTQVVKAGSTLATADADYTAKVDVTGLRPGETYYYQFHAAGASTVIGRTKTLPTGNVAQVKLVAFTCSDWEDGYFNAYADAALLDDLDVVLHVGDYIYEYGHTANFGRAKPGLDSPAIDLGLVPQVRLASLVIDEDLLILSDYRARHALYRTDTSLQELHRKNPWITIWDDHESANNSWTGGAENHHPSEGPWKPRELAAIKAYYEWLPIRNRVADPAHNLTAPALLDAAQNPQGMYRYFDFGNLMRLIMLDTRLAGRDLQLDPVPLLEVYAGQLQDTLDGTANTRQRDIFGPAQRAWLLNTVATSTQTWQIFGNQILEFLQTVPDINNSPVLSAPAKAGLIQLFNLIFGPAFVSQLLALAPRGIPNPAFNDSWTGYPSSRAFFYQVLLSRPELNPVLLTGDSHNAWTANLIAPVPGVGKVPAGVEFGMTSVTSGGLEQTLVGFPPQLYAALLVESSGRVAPADKLIFTDQSQRGYIVVTVTPAATRCDHVFLSTVFSQTYTTTRTSFQVPAYTRTATQI